jgi:hypothetical protein
VPHIRVPASHAFEPITDKAETGATTKFTFSPHFETRAFFYSAHFLLVKTENLAFFLKSKVY